MLIPITGTKLLYDNLFENVTTHVVHSDLYR